MLVREILNIPVPNLGILPVPDSVLQWTSDPTTYSFEEDEDSYHSDDDTDDASDDDESHDDVL
jgi:hypothetical protein